MNRLLARLYDPVMQASEEACLRDWRAELLAGVEGVALEIGAGTGASLPAWGEGVSQLYLAEPTPAMAAQLAGKIPERLRGVAEVVPWRADATGLGDASVDVVLSSLVLCSVPDLDRALAEIYRVLRPGGRLVFMEHVADDERPDRLTWQRRVEPVWRRLAGNCHLTRRTDRAIEAAGFEIEQLTRESIRKAMPLARRSARGWAIKA